MDELERIEKEYSDIPGYTLDGLANYLFRGVAPGSFLRNVLRNNLTESINTADSANARALVQLIGFLYNEIPYRAWGSQDRYDLWLDMDYGERLRFVLPAYGGMAFLYPRVKQYLEKEAPHGDESSPAHASA